MSKRMRPPVVWFTHFSQSNATSTTVTLLYLVAFNNYYFFFLHIMQIIIAGARYTNACQLVRCHWIFYLVKVSSLSIFFFIVIVRRKPFINNVIDYRFHVRKKSVTMCNFIRWIKIANNLIQIHKIRFVLIKLSVNYV